MSRRTLSKLPSAPQHDPSIPRTDPFLAKLKQLPPFSSEWFAEYDLLPREKQAKYKRDLLKKNPSYNYQGIENYINIKRKQNETAKIMKSTLESLPKVPTSTPKHKTHTRPATVTTQIKVTDEIRQECEKIKKEAERYLKHPAIDLAFKSYPEIHKKYRQRIVDEYDRLINNLRNDCFLNGNVPTESEFFKPLDVILSEMTDDMRKSHMKGGRKTRKHKKSHKSHKNHKSHKSHKKVSYKRKHRTGRVTRKRK